MVNIQALEGRANFFAPDSVFVGLRNGIETRVEFGRRLGDLQDADVSFQKAIDGLAKILDGYGILEMKRGDLRECMDSRIRASGAFDSYFRSFDFADDAFKFALDGGKPGLHLPTVIVGS